MSIVRAGGGGPAGLDGMSSGTLITVGVLFLIGGFIAFLAPTLGSVSGTALVGTALLAAAVLQCAAAFQGAHGWGRIGRLALALLSFVAGIWAFANPVQSTITFTILLAIWLVGEGLIQFVTGLTLKDEGAENAGWMIAAALLSVVLGFFIMFQLPSSALWAIGLVIGVELVSHGAQAIALGMAARAAKS